MVFELHYRREGKTKVVKVKSWSVAMRKVGVLKELGVPSITVYRTKQGHPDQFIGRW